MVATRGVPVNDPFLAASLGKRGGNDMKNCLFGASASFSSHLLQIGVTQSGMKYFCAKCDCGREFESLHSAKIEDPFGFRGTNIT